MRFILLSGFLLITAGCEIPKPVKTPVKVCEETTAEQLKVTLPEAVQVSEQEIHGERIVVNLAFKHPGDMTHTQVVCVYGFDRYNEEGKQQLYRKVPTRMAINGRQLSEQDLLAVLKKRGLIEN
ncbi:MAG: hypothetical protein ACPG51_08315 [Thiolinea sp.]